MDIDKRKESPVRRIKYENFINSRQSRWTLVIQSSIDKQSYGSFRYAENHLHLRLIEICIISSLRHWGKKARNDRIDDCRAEGFAQFLSLSLSLGDVMTSPREIVLA